MLQIGKKGKAWINARTRLKKEFYAKDITSCEICRSNYILSFHHRHKRRFNDEHTFENVILLCAQCHQLLEYDKNLTQKWFEKLRNSVTITAYKQHGER